MANLVDIIKGIVSNLDLNLRVTEIDGLKIYVCSTKHVTITKIVEDEAGNKFKVVGYSFDEYLELEPINHTDPFVGSIVIGPAPICFAGTPSSVNNEYLRISGQRTLDKTPFVWLLESYEYDDLPLDSSIEFAFDARLFLMDWANEKKWRNSDHNEIVIKPMENLAQMIIDYIESDYSFKRLGTKRIRPRSRFGVEVTNKGNTKKIINEDLSGVELNLTLELYDLSICNAKC
tara:strand:+ start:650 stop:1345 length:696 start_codon:yes stop_codon:yes gene_type:complete